MATIPGVDVMTTRIKGHIFYTYEIPPVDHGWHNLQRVDDFISGASRCLVHECANLLIRNLTERGASHVIEEPRLFWFPVAEEVDLAWAIILKVYNNGATLIAASAPLPHLDEYKTGEALIGDLSDL